MDFFVYIIYSQSIDKYYIGQTYNIESRLEKHNNGLSRFTKQAKDWIIVYTKSFKTRSEAMKFEKYLKTIKNRGYLQQIIKGD